MNPARRLARRFAVAACVLTTATCDSSPTGPHGVGERVAVGFTVEGRADSGATLRFSFVAAQDGEYAVFLAAPVGVVELVVADSTHSSQVAVVSAGPASGPLLTNATQNFPATKGTVFLLTLIGLRSQASYQFQVFAVTAAPERRPARFTIGDTIAGEDIDPLVDVDTFTTSAAGGDIVVVVQPLGAVGAGALALLVTDTSKDFLGYSANDAGTATPHTSGRIRLPLNGDYQFWIRGVTSNLYPRYRGPYRFWSYAINRAPEHRPATIAVGAVVFGEKIDLAGDIDEFSFPASPGASFNAFIQAPHTVQLEVAPVSGFPLAAALSDAADTALFGVATGRFTLPQGGSYVVRVLGTTPSNLADTGSYRFLLYPIDPRPEHISATIAAGDTVSGESIDVPGDVDEFPLPGAPGDEYNVFFQARTGSPLSPLELEIVDDSGTVRSSSALSSVRDTSLTQQQSGRFVMPGTGGLRLRISGASSVAARDTGAYRLRLYRVNRRPERVPDTLVFGDSVLGERIDLPGDVDEYQVIVADTSGANLVVQIDSTATDTPLEVSLVDSTGHVGPDLFVFTPGGIAQTSTMPISPGKYTLRVQGYYDRSTFVGGYRVWLYQFRFGPEVAPDTMAIGDTITNEALDPPGDIDVFSFFGQRGDHVNVALQGLGVPGNGAFLAMLSASGQPPFSFVVSPMHADSLGAYQSNRIDFAQTGWYQLRISGASSPTLLSEKGPYRFAITRWSTAPEHVGAALAPGDSVTGEVMDYSGDWDEFTVTGAPGQMLAVVSRTLSGSGSAYLIVFDSTTGDTLAKGYPQTFDTPTERFTLPANGHAELAVYSQGFVGPYRFTVVPVNPAPENVPTAFALGDTVRGEAIAPATDMDEFTGMGTPGDTLAPWWRLTADPVPAGGLMTLQIVDPATGAVLVGSNVSIFAATPEFFTPGQFTVPASGNFVVRVRAYYDNDMTTAPYEFYVAPVP